METGICIRKAQEQDASAVHRLIGILEETTFDQSLFETYFVSNIKDPRNIYLVATINGKVGAFISCHSQLLLHHLDFVYEIQEMIVDEAYRGHGLGLGLIKHLEKELRLRKCKFLEVCSSKLRERAHEFYQNAGFNRTHYKFTKSFETVNAG
ncbi:MAG: GNAT family N-acetyltransferase [Chitinophagaceae bacterium]